MRNKVAVVAGAAGVTGSALIKHLETLPDWETIGLSRRNLVNDRGRSISVDLLNKHDVTAKSSQMKSATHLFHAALQGGESFAAEVKPNLTMLQNTVEALEATAPAFERVVLVQGPKAYGAHLGPCKTPYKETDPRHMPPNFYYDQEDYLKERSVKSRWSWTALRPSLICGFSVGNQMNILMAIAVYATICKEFGLPLHFPGKQSSLKSLFEATDAGLLAKALVWAATHDECAGQVFNVTNGDLFRWDVMWSRIADAFQMERGNVIPIRLVEFMADKGPVWDRIVRRHGLKPYTYGEIVSWGFADAIFGIDYDVVSDTTKIRQAGFGACIDTEDMFARQFEMLRDERIIPPL